MNVLYEILLWVGLSNIVESHLVDVDLLGPIGSFMHVLNT